MAQTFPAELIELALTEFEVAKLAEALFAHGEHDAHARDLHGRLISTLESWESVL